MTASFSVRLPERTRPHFRAEQAHPENVELLALHVDFAHINDAFQAEKGGRGGGGHAVLAGAGLGHEAALSHFEREEALADDVVYLVAAGVVQVLALQQDPHTQLCGEVMAFGQGAGPAGIIPQHGMVAVLETRVGPGGPEIPLQVLARRDQRLGDEPAAEIAEAPPHRARP